MLTVPINVNGVEVAVVNVRNVGKKGDYCEYEVTLTRYRNQDDPPDLLGNRIAFAIPTTLEHEQKNGVLALLERVFNRLDREEFVRRVNGKTRLLRPVTKD